jgi:hypothetical protein
MKVLVAHEETYRFYRSVIAKAIKDHRPHLQVCSAALEAIEEALVSFDPHVVICSRPSARYHGAGRGAWVEQPAEPTETGELCLGGVTRRQSILSW